MKPIDTFSIRETDEDNYDDSGECSFKPTPHLRRNKPSSNALQAGGAAIFKGINKMQTIAAEKTRNTPSPMKYEHSLTPVKVPNAKTQYGIDSFSFASQAPMLSIG